MINTTLNKTITQKDLWLYLDPEYYAKSIKILDGSLEFLDVSELEPEELDELAKIYMNAYNQNNSALVHLGIGQGFWKEELWTFETAKEQVRELLDYTTLVAVGKSENNSRVVLGLSSYKPLTYPELVQKWRYSSGNELFNIPESIGINKSFSQVMYAADTFRRPAVYLNGQPVKGLASLLKQKNEERILAKSAGKTAFAASTRNERMKNVWIQNGYDVFEFSFYDGTNGWACVKLAN